MNMIRQLLGNHNHNHSHAPTCASSSPAYHQPQQNHSEMQKRGKSHGGAHSWGGRAEGQGADDNSSTTTGITEFSRSMSRDFSLPLQQGDILEERYGDSDNKIIYKNSCVTNDISKRHLRSRSSSCDAKTNSSVLSSASPLMPGHSTRHHRSRSSRRKKKNKDRQTVALNHRKNNELHFAQNDAPQNAVDTPTSRNDTIEYIDLKDPAPTTPTTKQKQSVEVEEHVVASLEEYQHEIKRLERLNATLTANLETLTAAALLNGEGNSGSTTPSTATDPITTAQPCPSCSRCCGSGVGNSGGSTGNPHPHRESLASSYSGNDIYHDMMLTETHYLSKISKLQKSNHKLTSELERKKKLISQLLLNLSMAADKIKELSSIGSEKNKNNDRLGGNHSTHDDDIAGGDGRVVSIGMDGGRMNDEASSMQQIRQYQMQVIENELQSLLQVMNARSALHAQRRHVLIDEYRRKGHSDGNDGHHRHGMLDETPEEIMQRVVRNLRGDDDGKEEAGHWTDLTTLATTDQEQQLQKEGQQQQEEEVAQPPPPPPVSTLMAAKYAPGATIWDSVTSLFYRSGPTHSQAPPQRQEELQLQLNKVAPSLEVQEHPLCEEVKTFDKNCLRKTSPNDNTIILGEREAENRSKSNDAVAKTVECSAKYTTAPLPPPSPTTAGSFIVHTGSSDDVYTNLAVFKLQENRNDVAKAADVDSKSPGDNHCHSNIDYNSLSKEAPSEVHLGSADYSIGFSAPPVIDEYIGSNFSERVPVLTEEYMIDESREVDEGIVDSHENSTGVDESDVIERKVSSNQYKTEDIESYPLSGRMGSQTLWEDCVTKRDGSGTKDPDTYDINLVNPIHDEDDSAELYTAKEPKDEDESLEQVHVRSGDIEDECDDCVLENEPIVHGGGGDDNNILLDANDENEEINENGGFENSYIGVVSLSNANSVPVGTDVIHEDQLKDDKPDNSSTFDQNLLQLSSTPAHDELHSSLESMTLSSTLPESTPKSEKRTLNPALDLATVEIVEKMLVGNKTMSETLGTLQGKRLARFDDSIDERSMMYHHGITSFYRKPSSTNSNGDDSLSIRLGRRQLFQHQGPLDLSDFQLDVYGDWQILVKSRDNDKYFVPRYKIPVLPPQSNNRTVPLFKKGLKDGHYRYASSSGNEYSGHWVNGKRHGYGMAKYRDGEVYHGQWRRGRRHGHGVLHLSNREVFDGNWLANKKHGLGMYFWTDGEVDISWYQDDVRLESLRWTSDRRRAYRLDLTTSKKEQISLARAADIIRDWERKRETDVD